MRVLLLAVCGAGIVLVGAIAAIGGGGKAMSTKDERWANVARNTSSLRFVAMWADEQDNHGESPDFETVDEAVLWARSRASTVHVVLGFSHPQVFSAGEQYDAGEEPVDAPLAQWPPAPDVRERLLADQRVPARDRGTVQVIGEETSRDR